MNDSICIIPARGVSPNLPKRNFKRINGKPLVAYTIESAIECEQISEVYVSTESERLASIAREYGAQVPFLRPESLSEEDVLLPEVISYHVEQIADERTDITISEMTPIVVLQPNVPFRRDHEITEAIETFQLPEYDSVISVSREQNFYWRDIEDSLVPTFEDRSLRTELEPLYQETGSIYVTSTELLADGTRVGDDVGYVVGDKLSAFEVNSVLDLWIAERIAQGPNVVFRVDGGGDIGMGHIYRCLTIAEKLSQRSRTNVTFVCRAAYTAGIEQIEDSQFDYVTVADTEDDSSVILSLNPDIVFFDILNTRKDDVARLQEELAAVVNLEDLAGGLHHADFVINALYEESGDRSNHKSGADYFILRDEFSAESKQIPETAENLLITFGGSDPSNLTTRVLSALEDTVQYLSTTVVLGPGFEHTAAFAELPATIRDNVTVKRAVSDMAELMAWADLAVVSGGRTVYELAAMGTPAIVITQNEREHSRMSVLMEKDVIEYLGEGSSVTEQEISETIEALRTNAEKRKLLSRNGMTYVDGNGTQRVLDIVFESLFGIQATDRNNRPSQ